MTDHSPMGILTYNTPSHYITRRRIQQAPHPLNDQEEGNDQSFVDEADLRMS